MMSATRIQMGLLQVHEISELTLALIQIVALLLLACLEKVYVFQHFKEGWFKIVISILLWLLKWLIYSLELYLLTIL